MCNNIFVIVLTLSYSVEILNQSSYCIIWYRCFYYNRDIYNNRLNNSVVETILCYQNDVGFVSEERSIC